MITNYVNFCKKKSEGFQGLSKKNIRARAFSSDQPVQHTKLLKFKNILLT